MSDVLILGAGMAGLGAALALQARGLNCVILDRGAPGQETSYGNAGILQSEASEPYALPRSPISLLQLALGQGNAVALDPLALPGQAGALLRYWMASRPSQHAKATQLYHQLISEAIPAHAPLITAAGADNIIQRDGYWEVYRTESAFYAAETNARRVARLYGHANTIFSGEDLHRAEPGLRGRLAGAVLWSGPWRASDPGGLVQAYAALFEQRGGRIMVGDATTLEQRGAGWRAAGIEAAQVVVALGPWSPELLRPFGYHVPMVAKRGYHLHFDGAHGLNRSVVDAERNIVLSPMKLGLRLATGAELSRRAVDHPRQLLHGERAARELLEIGNAVEQKAWSGTRPCLPGMLPLVTQAPRHKGLWLHFGHGHQGFTLGPATGERLARAMTGEPEAIAGLDQGIS
ncbi:NAD(P)/FAD-dependent oxidoreductase [Puniceibacterium sediminis]|uniref:D-amino-acid dehydrogenase n=1 Tax=Puniceibacterium sediminis TaxID=1608407 RepID=A0A238WUG9_9RHOB|nr:FAD-dependent oxidoreductase [Puniceibacterium sediminis]SNR50247.1 D-amino-acid dehydrogenase [Puniceibacterium sediminis]